MSTGKEKTQFVPNIHFAPVFGWLNDPNGLVWHDGVYELYIQHNPDAPWWANMTWGHARSTDLVHWEELEPTLYPDENGLMFSGCGLRNDRELLGLPKDALLFPYTAASHRPLSTKEQESTGSVPAEHFRPHFTIRLAYSTDGGDTMIKKDGTILDELEPDNRDPKVFWHEASKAYILVLWLKENEFGIFRSPDLEKFELSQRVTLNSGYECPDLFELPVEEESGELTGETRWVFWAADGSYYVGSFDGYSFTQEQPRRLAYTTSLPYAAQTWSGDPKGRVISTAWLRTKTVGGVTTGI
ncbi:MAG: glycoside hydrolase family 32 protein, partial [Oscillospiraceae bacterium]|nr:glycoside hydrolase family 32 protein [Oscillospiraceae bacterium]